ncbi:RagB/SusD family nutrient uptake outer membrane protein [Belliella sp. R4-6]|uniref:RagB/SusD family nutrient uptake outer membrane protein n=1 Tax=Belliella alkalica TaxID=1730871 RepID=A0ABS9VEE0_9BACT|nr:RagB/SusD family nutrient uptake outer membrane protein [Belliella alkalica]MCH7414813.1 RagB/SusD family nutrient uptake outer membrane protein [Belliella alkalica]
MKKIKYIALLAGSLFAASACSDLLDTEPKQSISVEGALASADVLTGLLINCYDDYQSNARLGSAWFVMPEIMADNFTRNINRGTFGAQFNNTLNAHMGAWGNYSTMLRLNVVIEGADVLPPAVVGEAYALRALSYFYLMNIYAYMPTNVIADQNRGGVPLITSAVLDIADVTFPARASIDEVYDFMLADIERAIGLLATTGTKARFTKASAAALGSRIALYRGNWSLAAQYAEDAISSGIARLSTPAAYASDWATAIHPEALWYLEFQNNENQGPNESLQSIYISGPTTLHPDYVGNGDFTPSLAVRNLITANPSDVRNGILKPQTIVGRANAVGTIEMHKFQGNTGQPNTDNIPIFRMSEMYLNLAEARYHLNQIPAAQAALQTLKRRNLNDAALVITTTGADLLEEILTERRLELLGEGHRFFDLKRYGRDIDKTASDLIGEVIEFNDRRILAPLPSGDLNINPNLINNFGY